jgi:hypothetical protein
VQTVASGAGSITSGFLTTASGIGSWAGGHSTSTSGSGSGTTTTNNHDYAYVWQGYSGSGEIEVYRSHGNGTYNVKPVGGLAGFYVGETSLATTLGGYVPWTKDKDGWNSAVTIGHRMPEMEVGVDSLAQGVRVWATGTGSFASGSYSSATGYAAHAEGDTTSAKGRAAHSEGSYTSANGNFSHAAGERAVVNSADHRAFAWQGAATTTNEFYRSHGPGTFNLNPEGGADGVFIGEESLRALVRRLVAEELAAQGD